MKKNDSTPRKHHYVPQTQIKKFKSNEGYYHLYDKGKHKFIQATNSKSFFYEKDLNSDIDLVTNEVNHSEIEKQFTEQWDSTFNIHFDKLVIWLKQCISLNDCNDVTIKETLKYFFEYGIAGRFRQMKSLQKFNSDFEET